MNIKSIVENQQKKVEVCLKEMQQQLDVTIQSISNDQSSFSRIDALLDQLPLAHYSPVVQKNVNIAPPVAEISLISLKTLPYQVVEEVKPIINLTIHKKIKEQHLSQLQQHLNQLQNKEIQQSNQIHQIIINNENQELNSKPFSYNLIENNPVKQKEWCKAIAFNQDNSIVLTGCNEKIIVFEFKQEQLNQTQLISEHQNNVTTLHFMKKSKQFISGSEDNQIIIWYMNQENQFFCQQKLNEHTNYIRCLLLNNNEDLIISGSDDKTIKFWEQQNQWGCSLTITDHTGEVYGLSMNEQQNKVISCGYDQQILIIEQSTQNQSWNIIQKINVEDWGYRICFINETVFTFQPNCKEQMHIYEINSTNKQYEKTKEITVKCGYFLCNYYFPLQYIKQKFLIVNKNGSNVNLIRKNQNSDLIILQSIDYGGQYIYGQMSEDGQYLISWDYNSKEIQIRKFHQD